jgi:hypothetical protein
MDESPETLRELAQYLRNSTRLFPSPRARKAYEWLAVKAAEADDHATVWEADRKRLQALRQMYREHAAIEDLEIDALIIEYISAQEASDNE